MKTQKATYQSSLPSNTRNKLVLRRTRKRFNPRTFLDRTIETFAIISLLFTGFAGVGAMGCWGIEIATSSQHWQQHKKTCLGMMLVFSTSNNVVLNDAFSILGEIVDAIDQVEQFSQQGESSHGARN